MAFVIRAGEREDADGIADDHIASWRAGDSHTVQESVLYADGFESSKRDFWRGWRFAPCHRLAVATTPSDERVVRFASHGPERERARALTGRGEVWAFYVHPLVWGSGLADELLAHTEVSVPEVEYRKHLTESPT